MQRDRVEFFLAAAVGAQKQRFDSGGLTGGLRGLAGTGKTTALRELFNASVTRAASSRIPAS